MIHIIKVHWNIQGQYNEKSPKKRKNPKNPLQVGFFMFRFLGFLGRGFLVPILLIIEATFITLYYYIAIESSKNG